MADSAPMAGWGRLWPAELCTHRVRLVASGYTFFLSLIPSIKYPDHLFGHSLSDEHRAVQRRIATAFHTFLR